MKAAKILWRLLLFVGMAPAAFGQFLGISGGWLQPQNLASVTARSNISSAGIFTLDAGVRVFPYVTAGLHYSSFASDLLLERGDFLGSSAEVELRARTFTFDTRLRSPFVSGFRFYGLAGVGITRFGMDVKRSVEVPFPGGAPDGITSFAFTYGGGLERHLRQLLHLKLEVRDYRTPISDQLFRPGGSWHRLAVIGGFTIGL
ncbi:MAG: hypothetical protein HY649_11660 [Acidobacteria bacterium]|nr:hypothetical protein [Acidobacteriota bacterium]